VIDVPDGQVIEVEIKRNGYKPEIVKLDGAIARHVIKLDRSGGGGAPRPAAKPEKPSEKPSGKKKGSMGGDIVNPWD
jgi:hypothetical protein